MAAVFELVLGCRGSASSFSTELFGAAQQVSYEEGETRVVLRPRFQRPCFAESLLVSCAHQRDQVREPLFDTERVKGGVERLSVLVVLLFVEEFERSAFLDGLIERFRQEVVALLRKDESV